MQVDKKDTFASVSDITKRALENQKADKAAQKMTRIEGLSEDKGIAQVSRKVAETFGVDEVIRTERVERFADSGYDIIESGITKGIRLADQRDQSKNPLRFEVDLLERWKREFKDKSRNIVFDYSKSAADKVQEKLNSGELGINTKI